MYNKTNRIGIIILLLCFIVPIILPRTYELLLSIKFDNLSINILDLIFILFSMLSIGLRTKYTSFYTIGLIMVAYSIVSAFVHQSVSNLIQGLFISFAFVTIGKCRISLREIRIVRIVSISLLLYIFLQEVILGLGLFEISTPAGEDLGSASGEISRISTTVGAATGTGVVIQLLIFLYLLSNDILRVDNKLTVFSVNMISIMAGLLTFSKGAVLGLSAFFTICYIKKIKFGKLMMYLPVLAIIFYGLLIYMADANIFELLLMRDGKIEYDNGRYGRWDDAFKYLDGNEIFGMGTAALNQKGYWAGDDLTLVGPHNIYVIFLVENGIFFLTVYMSFIVYCMLGAYKNNSLSFAAVITTALITSNVESAYIDGFYIYGFVLVLALALSNYRDHEFK